ncbi:MAG TPA: hypothetical protein VE110_06650 [Gemmatimonadaceae bacterium]|nr:hypothetical protein [Gemmatimonadaceae bacterium]
MMKRLPSAFLVALAVVAPSARAQRYGQRGSTPIELGVDAAMVFGLDNPHTTAVTLPVPSFRIGFIVDNNLELEPRLQVNSVHVAGLGTLTDYDFQLGVLFMPGGDRVGKDVYIRPFLGFSGTSASGAGSNSNGDAGVGLGVKLPFADRRLATRLEAAYDHGFGNGGTNAIGLFAGLSFFTR